MKELHFLVSWNFLNIYVELLLKILLIGLFWKYPCKQKHVQSQRQKKKKTLELLHLMLFECLYY